MTPDELRSYEHTLGLMDPVMDRLAELHGPLVLREPGPYFESLCSSIVSQQVSLAAAKAIFGRLTSETGLVPERVALICDEQVKLIGLSRQKAGYLRDLGSHFASRPGVYDHLDSAPDERVIAELTAIKGIGVWSAQMFLIFTLQRPDVFAPADVGLQQAIARLYGADAVLTPKPLALFAERWAPYRTVASLYLWRSLDNGPQTKN